MKTLRDMTRAERVDSWSTAFLILMLVHLAIALGGTSLLLGVLVAAGYLFVRRRLRQYRMQGRGGAAWTVVRIFENLCVTYLVFFLGSMIAGLSVNEAIGYGLGGILAVGFAIYRIATWHQQYAAGKPQEPPTSRDRQPSVVTHASPGEAPGRALFLDQSLPFAPWRAGTLHERQPFLRRDFTQDPA